MLYKLSAWEQSKLYQKSQVRKFWLKIVPAGQRKENF